MLNKEDLLLYWTTVLKLRFDWGEGLLSYFFKPYSYAGITGALIKIINPAIETKTLGWIIGILGIILIIIIYFAGYWWQKSGAVNYINNYTARKTVPFNEQTKNQLEAIGDKLGIKSKFQ